MTDFLESLENQVSRVVDKIEDVQTQLKAANEEIDKRDEELAEKNRDIQLLLNQISDRDEWITQFVKIVTGEEGDGTEATTKEVRALLKELMDKEDWADQFVALVGEENLDRLLEPEVVARIKYLVEGHPVSFGDVEKLEEYEDQATNLNVDFVMFPPTMA